jgi:transposase InsO family protein
VQPSMGTAGDAYDNAMCESFFGTLEAELLMREHFATHEQARARIFWFLELGSPVPLRTRSPRRTVRASFPAYGSSTALSVALTPA